MSEWVLFGLCGRRWREIMMSRKREWAAYKGNPQKKKA